MQMIEVDNVWQLKTFEAVLTDLRRRWDERSQKQKDVSMHLTENSKTNDEMEGIEAFDLCNENQTKNSEFHERKESTKQESRIKMKNKTITRTESKNRQCKGKPMAESEENKTVMMCWEKLKDSPGKEPHEEPENEGEKSIKKMQNSKDEEEQVDSTLYTGTNQKSLLKNLVGRQKMMDQHLKHKKQNNISWCTLPILKMIYKRMVQNCMKKKAQRMKSVQQK